MDLIEFKKKNSTFHIPTSSFRVLCSMVKKFRTFEGLDQCASRVLTRSFYFHTLTTLVLYMTDCDNSDLSIPIEAELKKKLKLHFHTVLH